MEYRPLEGFVFAVSPFNFTAIGGEPPASARADGQHGRLEAGRTASYSAHFLMRLLQEAGLPAGVINLVYGSGATIGDAALASEHLAGVHFTGSTGVFQLDVEDDRRERRPATATTRASSARPAARTSSSRTRPRTSTPSRRRSSAARSSTRARSARPPRGVYAPANLWPELRERLAEEVGADQDGRRRRLRELHGRGHRRASRSRRRSEAIDEARAARQTEVLVGGGVDDDGGLLRRADRDRDARPRLPAPARRAVRAGRDRVRLPEGKWSETLELVDPHCAVRAHGRRLRRRPQRARSRRRRRCATRPGTSTSTTSRPARSSASSRSAAARVGHERQGGLDVEPASAGCSPRTIKETFVPPTDYRYPFMARPTATGERRHR